MAAAVVAVILAATACVPPEGPQDPFGLRISMSDGALDLSWHAPGGEPQPAYEVQRLIPGGTWEAVGVTEETAWTYTQVSNRTRYMFRVGPAPSASSDREFSQAVAAWYVDTVLPVVRIDTEEAAPIVDRENYVRGTFQLDPNGHPVAPVTGAMGIRGRGNSTWVGFDKKPYRIKLDTKASVMGMAAERDWILLAMAFDRSQLRSYGAQLASQATVLPWTPDWDNHVEVVLNGVYQGVYLLSEHNEVGPDRVDITEMEPEDDSGVELTGGYRLEIDDRLEENNEPGWRTTRGVPIVVKDPDPYNAAQGAYIRSFVQAFEDSLFAPNWTDPALGYRRYLHVPSYVDHYLVEEVTRNQDHGWSSTFFTKERGDDLLRSGPVWDFDASMGTTSAYAPSPPGGFRARLGGTWVRRLFQDPALVAQVSQRWQELRPAFAQNPAAVLARGAELEDAVLNDAAAWYYTPKESDSPQYLANWLVARIAWLDTQYGG